MAQQMELPVFLINIERAAARRRLIEQQAATLGIPLERVAGVDGSLVPPADWVDADRELFLKRNGRPMMAGEYGCYKSHLKALERTANCGAPAALVIEDDIALSADFLSRAQSVAAALPQDCAVKLVNHRTLAFRHRFTTATGDRIGVSPFGPQGSAACYLVTAAAARQLCARLKVQSLPFDMALERAWHHGVPIYTSEYSISGFGNLRNETLIASQSDYRGLKLRGLKKIPTHLFRVGEALRRFAYALVQHEDAIISLR